MFKWLKKRRFNSIAEMILLGMNNPNNIQKANNLMGRRKYTKEEISAKLDEVEDKLAFLESHHRRVTDDRNYYNLNAKRYYYRVVLKQFENN